MLSDAEDGAGHRARSLADLAAVIAGFDDPLSTSRAAGDHADVVRPYHYGADLRTRRTAPTGPVVGQIIFRSAALLGPHPPAAPARRTAAEVTGCRRLTARITTGLGRGKRQ